MITQTDIQFTVSTDWRSAFELYLQQDYRRISPTHRSPSQKTVKAAIQHIRVFSLWWEAKFSDAFSLEKVTNFDLHAYRHHSLEEARVAPDTWNSRLWALRIFTTWIHATLGESYADLADGIEPKEQGLRPSRYRSLTDQEYGYLVHRLERRTREAVTEFEYQTAVRDQAAIAVMLFAGLRVEEVTLLDLSDITINERSGQLRVRNGKGSKERAVPLNLHSRRALALWMDVRPQVSSMALFTGKQSDRISTRHIERIVSELGAESRIPGLSPHWLRYTFAKRLEHAGTAIEQIRDLLGHESIETTRRYLRSSFDELQSAVEMI
jgi:site-specific recombinase XerC